MADKDVLEKEKKVIIKRYGDTGAICPPGKDYCWECGWVDWPEAFLKKNRCPNPRCPSPHNWDD